MTMPAPFYIQKENVYGLPILHYNMETAWQVIMAFKELQPDCVAVELPQTMELQFLHAASRLPDISLVTALAQSGLPLYFLCQPCDALFEGLRCALERGVKAFCIDLDIDDYPEFNDPLPDPYAISKIGLAAYYQIYQQSLHPRPPFKNSQDYDREIHMAKRLKELTFSHEKILFITGFYHLDSVFKHLDNHKFIEKKAAERSQIQLCTLSEHSARDTLAECGWFCVYYENERRSYLDDSSRSTDVLDRQQLIYSLYKQAALNYTEKTGNAFASYNMRNLMKYMRNYALITDKLMPDLFQILSCARSCVDGNFAYETWELATDYPYLKNIDNLPALDLTVEELWGNSKKIKFHLKQPSRKDLSFKKRPDKSKFKFFSHGSFGVCSYPPEDLAIENFGHFLKKKGAQILSEESSRTIPFSTSIEDGVDLRETIRHWYEKKLFVKVKGKPPGLASSVVMIFDEDLEENFNEKYPWKLTWHGEHTQESDMAFYATPLGKNIVGPGISRCEYGGLMLSSPPRRMLDIWHDPDYSDCRSKAEILLVAAIDYAIGPLVVYVAAKPPRTFIKSFAARFGKKIVYIPIGQLSPVLINKIRVFHVLDGHDKRNIAGEYIF